MNNSSDRRAIKKRTKILVQKPIQNGLALRCTMYWFSCLCTIFLFVAVATTFSGDLKPAGEIFAGIWRQYSTAVLASVFLLPLVIWDVIKYSHRVVGPLIRLENEIERLLAGEAVRPIHFRKDDYWHSLADRFNTLSLRHQHLIQESNKQNELVEVIDQN